MILTRFLIFIISFGFGILAASFVSFSFYLGLFFVFLGVIFKLLKLNFHNLLVLVLIAFGAGLFWYGFKTTPPADFSNLESRVNARVNLTGVIVDEPDERENYTRLVFEPDEGAKVLVTARNYPEFNYGDSVEIRGVLKKPTNFSDFSWTDYLAKDDIYFEMFYPEIKIISSNSGFWLKHRLFDLKERILFNIARVISEPHSSFLGGLTFGAKQSMPKDLLEDFRKTGIVHIVVLSGYNVAIVAGAVMSVFSFLPFLFGIVFGVLGIICFALMAGASATVVRAAIMAILVLSARATGRVYEITLALLVAGFLMILSNPKLLRFDVSFQLSFLAALSLIYLAPIVEPHLKFIPKKYKIREIVVSTIATQIFVLPLLLYKTGLFSMVGLPANLLILPFVPITMLFGFLTAAAGFFSVYLSAPFGWLAYIFLEYDLRVVDFFSSLSFSSFTISSFPLWLMLLVYLAYVILIFYGFCKKKF